MASEGKKRSGPSSKDQQRSKKRQKIETTKNSKPKRAVAVDALPWNEVTMPDMFNDAEGFFGLEEVEGVEIVKDGGNVKFVSPKCGRKKAAIDFGSR